MKFDELKKGESIFIDANIFIYHFGGQSDECKEILIKCAKGDLKGYTLTSILAEVLHRLMIAEAIEKGYISGRNPVRELKANPEIIKKLSSYIRSVDKINEMNIQIIGLTKELISESGKIRRLEGLLTNDSLVLIVMKEFDLKNLITNDNDFNHIKWLRIYKPSDLL
ncbi:MAG: PIN domain-containing protein [Nitrospirota bacterium]